MDDNIQATIIVDNGSDSMKIGFVGDEKPKVFPTVVGKSTLIASSDDKLTQEAYVGSDVQSKREILTLKYPVEKGVITNWNDMEKIWQYSFDEMLQVSNIAEHPILLTEAIFNPQDKREEMTQIMFEKFNVPLMYLANKSALSLYSCGKTNGFVLDIGYNSIDAIPIVDGVAVNYPAMRLDFGGYELTDYLIKLLTEDELLSTSTTNNISSILNTKSDRDIFRMMKENVIECSIDFEQLLARKDDTPMNSISPNKNNNSSSKNKSPSTSSSSSSSSRHSRQHGNSNNRLGSSLPPTRSAPKIKKSYKLPNGKVITVGKERFKCVEALFQPNLIGIESLGIHRTIFDSIFKFENGNDIDIWKNIVVAGGSSLILGLKERLTQELRTLVPSTTKIEIMNANNSSCSTDPNALDANATMLNIPSIADNSSNSNNNSSSSSDNMDTSSSNSANSNSNYTIEYENLSSWMGGSVFASISQFQQMCVTKEDYDEFGPPNVNKKCP